MPTMDSPHTSSTPISEKNSANVRATVSLPDGAPAEVDLFDTAGRRLARQALEGRGGTAEIVLPGTASLPAGLYFGRIVSGRASIAGRVIVLRRA
ncbi:MAG TPA: T9SS type A sorting domain-containing protein, partial [Candidatus Eisenbacteria bacterium]